MKNKTASPLKTLLVVAALQQFMMGGTFPFARYVLQRLDPFTVAFIRFGISALILCCLALRISRKAGTVPVAQADKLKIWGLGFLIIICNQFLYLYGQKYTTASHGGLIFATTPALVYLFAIKYLKEKISGLRGLGVFLTISGAALIFFERGIAFNPDYVKGDIIILFAVIAWALYTVWGKPLAEKYGALRMTAYALGAGTIIYFPYGLFRTLTADWSQMDGLGWLAIGYISIGTSVIGYTVWYWLLKQMKASRVAVLNNLQPLAAAFLGWYFLGETLTGVFILAFALIVAGILITQKA